MKMQANQMRPGWVIDHNGKQWTILKIQIITPGKGGAFIQVEMRDVATGTKSEDRWRTADTVEKLNSEDTDCQFLFADGDSLTFMHVDNYEQFSVPKDMLGDALPFLQDGMAVVVSFIEGKPVGIEIPKSAICEVAETEAVVKGQTAASSNKPAILDNGVRIMVPQFINTGDKIVVNTEELTYMERVKK
jgi:elongation factor P